MRRAWNAAAFDADSTRRFISPTMTSGVLGLMRTALAPARSALANSAGRVSLVTTRIGTASVARSLRRISHKAIPSISGSRSSVTTTHGLDVSAWTSASRPSPASVTAQPSRVNESRYSSRLSASPSTTSTRGRTRGDESGGNVTFLTFSQNFLLDEEHHLENNGANRVC